MSKFVRTKNKIYRVQKEFEDFINKPVANMCFYVNKETKEKEWCDAYYIGTGWIRVRDFIKQADTIEELCDEFILKSKTSNVWFVEPYINSFLEDLNLDAFDLFGAIWTDKGLIFVAKMNDKGELELL